MKIFTATLIFLAISFANFFLSIITANKSDLAGGGVGMLPILIMIFLALAFGASSIIYLLFKIAKKELSYRQAILLFNIVYIAVLFSGLQSPFSVDREDPYHMTDFWIFINALIVFAVSICLTYLSFISSGFKTDTP